MTIASATSRISYVGDGSTTAFAVPFLFQSNADITVMLQSSTGVQTTLVLGTGYSLSGAGVSSGGTCTFTVAPTALTGAVITIFRDPPVTQTTSYNNNDPFPAKSHENALDKVTMLEQRTRDMISRSIRLPDSDPSLSTQLPTLALRANKLLGFDGGGLPVAVLGPSFVGGTNVGVAEVSTKSVAAVTIFPNTILVLRTSGGATPGDGLAATYIHGTGIGAFTDGGGVSWLPVPGISSMSTSFVNAVGDGSTDDYAAIQATLTAAGAAGGGVVFGLPGRTYRVNITAATPSQGLVLPANVDFIGNGAKISFSLNGHVYGLRPLGKNRIDGWQFSVDISAGLSVTPYTEQAIWQTCITLGAAYGDGGTVASPSPFISASDIDIGRCTFFSVTGGSMVHGFTGGRNINIHDNSFLDSATTFIAVGFDWIPIGGINESALAATQTAYLAGTARTRHPSAISIRRNHIGHMTKPPVLSGSTPTNGSHGVRMSGCMSYEIMDNDIEETTLAGIFQTGGDLAFEFAEGIERYQAYRDTRISGNRMKKSNSGYSIYAETFADNIFDAFSNPANPQYPYSPFYLIVYPTDLEIKNNFCNGNATAGCLEGIYVGQTSGATVSGNDVQFHKNGIRVFDGAVDVKINSNVINNNREAGIFLQGVGTPIKTCVVDNNRVYGNYTAGSGSIGNICIDLAQRTRVTNNQIGASETTATVGLNITTNAAYTTIMNNHVELVKTGGTAYQLALPISTVWIFANNQYDGSDTYYAGLDVLAVRRIATAASGKVVTHYLTKQSALSGNHPNTGPFVFGDTCEVVDAINTSDVFMAKCTVAGTPGTWKTTIALP